MRTLDPNESFVLDTRELGRRPGTQRLVTTDVEAPAGLGIDILGVPEGSQIHLDLRLEAVMEGVLVTGTATADLEGECSRCLEPLEETLTVDLQELYLYDVDEADEEDAARVEDDIIDLEPMVRDAVVLALPYRPLCSAECAGLCSECGVRLADHPDHSHQAPVDPRWAALEQLRHND